MNPLRLALSILLAGAATSCLETPGPAPTAFHRARDRYVALHAADPQGVFKNPEVRALLPAMDQVPRDSAERDAASELARSIRQGIALSDRATPDHAENSGGSPTTLALVPSATLGWAPTAPAVAAAPVLPSPPADQITRPPADPNLNPNAVTPPTPNAFAPSPAAPSTPTAPVLPSPASDQIDHPPADPNVNPDAVNK